jgi:hypothetical protein
MSYKADKNRFYTFILAKRPRSDEILINLTYSDN